MTRTDDRVRSAIAEQASEWFVSNQSGTSDETARAEFVAWLKSSPMHVEEYLAIATIARDLGAASDDRGTSVDELIAVSWTDNGDAVVPFRRPGVERTSRVVVPPGESRRSWFAAAASLALALIAGWWALDTGLFNRSLDHETNRGQQGSWVLDDGSLLRLDSQSRATVRYSRAERVIELQLGRAFFAVAHDPARPFRVKAGSVDAVATGTQFAVEHRPVTTLVTVAEGRVVVREANGFGGPGGSATKPDVQQVSAGYQLRVDAGVAQAQPVPVDLSQALAWLRHKIAFEHRPLGEVADEFNRYGQVPLQIDDADLRALPVSGVFDADDVESFVAFLATLDGVRVARTGANIRIYRELRPDKQDTSAIR